VPVSIPDIPPEGASLAGGNPAYPYLQAMDAAVRELQATVAALTAPTGLVVSVNGVVPDGSGDVTLGPADVNAMAAGYAPGFGDLPAGVPDYVDKDSDPASPTFGFWPTGYNADGSPVYTNGSASHGTRPHARKTPVIWRGADPAPDSVSSGTGGMLRGLDERATPIP
jgi:hypothetical protein